MKKLLLLIAFALAAIFAQAQGYTRDSLFLEIQPPMGTTNLSFRQPHSIMTSDGNILTSIPTKTLMGTKIVDFGDWLYKIDAQSHAVVDSTFVETDYAFLEDNKNPLLANAPDGDGYIIAKLIHNKLSYQGFPGTTWLRISRIDNALNMQPHGDALKVLLEDSNSIDELIGITLEGEQIVLAYRTDELSPVVARIGLDGTIHEKLAYDNLLRLEDVTHGFAVYNDSPREYAIYDWDLRDSDTCLVYHVFDSLLMLKETIVMEAQQSGIYPVCPGLLPSSYTNPICPVQILPLNDGTFIQAFQYEQHNLTRNGACLQKYDRTTHECVAFTLFESWPIYSSPLRMGYPIGMVRTVNDNIYFAYRTNNNVGGGAASTKGWLGIAKLDKDLNVLWQRYCLGSAATTGGYLHFYCHASQIEDGFAIIGKTTKSGESFNFFYYFIHDEDPEGVPESDAFLRPYMYYPNPTQDRLHLQYSPDVQPKQVELYDLQGHLVRSQSQGVESVDMQGLASGQYLMKVTLEDGKSFTDKVVKE